MRREFPAKVRLAAFQRANGCCEGVLGNGKPCGAKLSVGKYEFDHDNPDGLTGEPTLANCVVLCAQCHKDKTKKDVANIARAKRREIKHLGAKPKSRAWSTRYRKRMDGTVVLRNAD